MTYIYTVEAYLFESEALLSENSELLFPDGLFFALGFLLVSAMTHVN